MIEHLMSDNAEAESLAPWMDMNFFILVGGRERSLQEYSDLFTACGFVISRVISTKTGRSIIELAI